MGPKRGARGRTRGDAGGGNNRGNRWRGNASTAGSRQDRSSEIPDSEQDGSTPNDAISIRDDTSALRQTKETQENDQKGATPEDAISIGDDTSTLRRSSRTRKTPARFKIPPQTAPARTPKRKASPELNDLEPEPEDPELPAHVTNDIIAASLEPWTGNEPEWWDGWAEVESNPEIFTDIVRKLGVKGAWIEEALVLDHLSNAFSQPVYGLVFLQKYASMRKVLLPNQPDNSIVWFAQQTATNACGTIAILNILMNVKDANLGDKLSEFKEQSKNLSPALRGNMIATSTFIRTAHSLHNRRIELLDAVRDLEELAIRNKKQRAAKAARNAKRTASSGRRRSGGATSVSFHFVAFVPIENGIWLLDGMETEPGYICEIANPKNWLEDVKSTLEAYMAEKEGTEYSLMAVCGGTDEGVQDVGSSRQNQFSLAIHEWVKRLAECEKLQELVKE